MTLNDGATYVYIYLFTGLIDFRATQRIASLGNGHLVCVEWNYFRGNISVLISRRAGGYTHFSIVTFWGFDRDLYSIKVVYPVRGGGQLVQCGFGPYKGVDFEG